MEPMIDKKAKFLLIGVTCTVCKNYSIIVEEETYSLSCVGIDSKGASYTGYAKLVGMCKLKGKVNSNDVCEEWN